MSINACVLVVVVVGVLCENCIVDAYFLHFHRGQKLCFLIVMCVNMFFLHFLSEKILFFFVLSVFCL